MKGSCALRIACCRRGSVAQRGGAFEATTMCLYAYGTTRCFTTQTADRQLCRGFDTGWCHAGLLDIVRDSLPLYRFRNNCVVAKKPLPLEPHINKGINDALHWITAGGSGFQPRVQSFIENSSTETTIHTKEHSHDTSERNLCMRNLRQQGSGTGGGRRRAGLLRRTDGEGVVS